MDCVAFDRWLDAGMPRNEAAARHAESCARCAASLAAMREIDAWLESDADAAAVPPAAPAGFTDVVMRRVAELSLPLPERLGLTFAADVFPWWVSALRHPATILAATLAAIVWWGRARMVESGFAAVAAAHTWWLKTAAAASANGEVGAALGRSAAETAAALAVFTDPYVAAGLALALGPLLVYLVIRLERWSEQLIGG